MAWSELLVFTREFRRHFHTTGALLPSSRALARRMGAPLARHPGPKRILEVGPGTGVFTAEIVRHLLPDDRLDVIEANSTFVGMLRERFDGEAAFRRVRSQCRLIEGYAPDAIDRPSYDYIISGLPMNNFEPQLVERILGAFITALVPGGMLSYFEYLYIREVKSVVAPRAERQRVRAVAEVTGSFIKRYQTATDQVFVNVPPAIARHFQRPSRAGTTSIAASAV